MGVVAHRGPSSGGQGAVSLAILETLPPDTILVFGSTGLLGEDRVCSTCYTRESETECSSLKKVFKQKKPLKKVSNKREKGPSQAKGTQSLLLSPLGEGTQSHLPSPPSLPVRGPGALCRARPVKGPGASCRACPVRGPGAS